MKPRNNQNSFTPTVERPRDFRTGDRGHGTNPELPPDELKKKEQRLRKYARRAAKEAPLFD